ncbi:CatA-like O-acetyltransferase [Butyrivibrio sp. MC2013]|uniref:CatA-like O-acetyltransferase n=1 Tax=Butyrivibrio sp. MC2013 TaxID=1280686 RepID=UPI000420548E|nr:CatA-like O-acetyltransferase [Butyrivibrio sp. MC2013]
MNYKSIDMSTYPRRDHFEYFKDMEYPFVTMTVQVDITDWLRRLKESGYPLFLCFQYAVSRAVNSVPEFRQRIRGNGIIEYDQCNPSYTVGLPDGTYRYCMVNADQPLKDYLTEAKIKQEKALNSSHLQEEEDVESLLYTSCVPWQTFSGLTMPYPDTHFSIPNVVWGKYTTEKIPALENGSLIEKDKTTIPVCVFVNHALIDGIHISAFFAALDRELKEMVFSGS